LVLDLRLRQKEDETLVTTGLYSKIRHPLYAGLVLIFLGYFLFAGTISAANLSCLLLYLPFGIYFGKKLGNTVWKRIRITGQQFRHLLKAVVKVTLG
jgi:steroid 5-alpha reductase family enzyme